MLVLPVIDLRGGLVVLGRAGQRAAYQPVRSVLAADPSPSTVAQGFASVLDLRQLYVADLDAIAGAEPDWMAYQQICAAGVRPWIDAGIDSCDRARAVVDQLSYTSGGYPIIGLESLASPSVIDQVLDIVGPESTVVSLDLDHGRPRTRIAAWRHQGPREIALALLRRGVRRLILLDIARVGMASGTGVISLLREVRPLDTGVELICGGGISTTEQIAKLASEGCDAVLIATAFHNGQLTRKEVDRVRHWTRPSLD